MSPILTHVIDLQSKGIEKNRLRKLERCDHIPSQVYKLESTYPTFKSGMVDDLFKWVLPKGGPYIIEGEQLGNTEFMVKNIDYVFDYGFVITLE